MQLVSGVGSDTVDISLLEQIPHLIDVASIQAEVQGILSVQQLYRWSLFKGASTEEYRPYGMENPNIRTAQRRIEHVIDQAVEVCTSRDLTSHYWDPEPPGFQVCKCLCTESSHANW